MVDLQKVSLKLLQKNTKEFVMKKNIGNKLVLYPTPVIVIGAIVNEKPTWTLVAHIGIPSHDIAMISLAKAHYINQGIREKKVLSINVVDESWLSIADKVGCVSGNNVDKSKMFNYTIGTTGAPMIDEAKLVMECDVIDVYEVGAFENFMVKVQNTFADDSILTEQGEKPDYNKFKPVLFEMPNYNYYKMGEKIAKCKSLNKTL